jgi:arylsulfatase A-like enzyme
LLFINYFLFGQNNSPNILIIKPDDMGFDDLFLHGNPLLEIPDYKEF